MSATLPSSKRRSGKSSPVAVAAPDGTRTLTGASTTPRRLRRMATELPDSVFHRDRERYVPTALARGPWDPNAQHGGPCAALLADLLERHDVGPPAHVARMTIELLRPVPMQPIE